MGHGDGEHSLFHLLQHDHSLHALLPLCLADNTATMAGLQARVGAVWVLGPRHTQRYARPQYHR